MGDRESGNAGECRVLQMYSSLLFNPMTSRRLELPCLRAKSDPLTMSSSTSCDASRCSNSFCAWNGAHSSFPSYMGLDLDTLARSNSLNQVNRQGSQPFKLMSLQLARRMTPEATKRRVEEVPLEAKVDSSPYSKDSQLRLFLQILHSLKAECRTVELF